MATVGLKQICKDYGKTRVVHHVDAEIKDGEFIVIVGPSGCGKSTVLRMIAGLETVSEGEVHINDTVVNQVEPKDRRIAMVFQNYALYPHMTVFNNMAYGLKLRKISKPEIRERVQEAARLLQLEGFLDRKPRQLSGGQRQRVAMGRALVRKPEVFLFDEPLSNLDAKLRHQMRTQLKQLHQRLGTTMIYVTHDQVEAMTLADRILVLNRGRVEQAGTPDEIYQNPVSAFVAGFIGSPPMNFLHGEMGADGALTLAGNFHIQLKSAPAVTGPVNVGIRPEKMIPSADGLLPVNIDFIERLGAGQLLYGRAGDDPVVVSVHNGTTADAGDTLGVSFDETDLHFFDPDSGKRIS